MTNAGKNFRYLRKLRGWTQEEFARKLKIKRSLIGAYEEERAEPRFDVLQTVCNIYKLSLEELLFQDLSAEKKAVSYLEKRRQLKLQKQNPDIQFVPVKAAAGYMVGYADPDFIDELNTFTLPMMAPGNYRAFEIVGDSMLPTPSGSVIVSEKIETLDDLKNNNAYIIVTKKEGIVYKRVLKNNRQKDKITLVSDNPAFAPYTLKSEEILEAWQAQMIIKKANTEHQWDVNQLAGLVSNLQQQVTSLKKKMN